MRGCAMSRSVHDIDQPAIVVTDDNQTIVLEGDAFGLMDTYTLGLAIAPLADVYVDIAVGDSRLLLSGPAGRFFAVTGGYRVKFTSLDYSPVTITVKAFDDLVAQDAHTTVITHTVNAALTADSRYAGGSPKVSLVAPERLYAKVLDDDSAGVLVLPSDGKTLVNVDPAGTPATDTYTLRYTPAEAARVAGTLLPDVLSYDTARPASFPDNGRTLTDDGFDLFMRVLTNGKVTGDNVGPHGDLLLEFPYVGPPHQNRGTTSTMRPRRKMTHETR